jgi:hypothetical protein
MTKLIIDLITSKNSLMENADDIDETANQEKTNMKKIKVSEWKLSVSDGMGVWIKDFQDSDAPQFADADEDERRTMAIAAYLAAKRESKKGADQVDELKTGTLLRYASKAGKDGLSKGIEAARASDMDDSEAAAALRQQRDKRYAGQNQALSKIRDKITKEAKQVNEAVKTPEDRKEISRLDQLVRVGLADKTSLAVIKRSIEKLKSGDVLNPAERTVTNDLLTTLIDIVTLSDSLFRMTKTQLQKEEVDQAVDKKEISRLDQLVRLGLADKTSLAIIKRSVIKLNSGDVLTPAERTVTNDLLATLLSLVTSSNALFTMTKAQLQKEETEIKEDELSQKKKEEVVTVKHKDSGKELIIVKTAVADYQKRGYYPVKESTSNYAQSANKILDDLKKANISAADKAKLAQLADLMAKMKDKE